RLGGRRAGGGAAHIDAGAVAARDFLIGEARDQHAAVERDDLAVARAACRLLSRTDIVLAVRPALEAQFGRLRLVGQMHNDAAARAASNVIGLLALAARRDFGARAIVLLVIGGKPPAPDQIGSRNASGQRRSGLDDRSGFGRWSAKREGLRGAAG